MRCSASTWSRTKLPSAGRAGEGYMFVTTSARMPRLRTFTDVAFAVSQSRHSFAPKSLQARVDPSPAARSIGGTPNPTAGRPQMPYRTMGWIHATAARLWRDQTGQGTVEYVGLMLLLATLLTGVVAAAGGLKGGGIAQEVAKTLKETISSVGDKK